MRHLFFIFILNSVNLIGQEFDLVETYTIESAMETIIPKGYRISEFAAHDQLGVSKSVFKSHITKTLDKKGEVVETVIHERPRHLEKWISHPHKTVVYIDGIVMYDAKGKEVFREIFDKDTKEKKVKENNDIKQKGNFQRIDFNLLSGKEKAEIANNKGKIKKLSPFSEEIEYDSLIIRNLSEQLIKQYIHKGNGKGTRTSVGTKYAVTDDGDYYMKTETVLNEKQLVSKDGTSTFGYDKLQTTVRWIGS